MLTKLDASGYVFRMSKSVPLLRPPPPLALGRYCEYKSMRLRTHVEHVAVILIPWSVFVPGRGVPIGSW